MKHQHDGKGRKTVQTAEMKPLRHVSAHRLKYQRSNHTTRRAEYILQQWEKNSGVDRIQTIRD